MPSLPDTYRFHTLPPELSSWIEQTPYPDLFDGGLHSEQGKCLQRLMRETPPLSPTCESGLWLLAGDLDRSHRLSQEITSPEGSYWHAIMHRRERDFWNSKYWLRKVGDHPVFREVHDLGKELLKVEGLDGRGKFDPSLFVDRCEALQPDDEVRVARLKQIAWLEWVALFRTCIELNG